MLHQQGYVAADTRKSVNTEQKGCYTKKKKKKEKKKMKTIREKNVIFAK